MERIQEIQNRHEMRKHSKELCNNPIGPPFEYTDWVNDDIEYLLAENKRLREALERISTFAIVGTVVHGEAMKEIALEALREDEV